MLTNRNSFFNDFFTPVLREAFPSTHDMMKTDVAENEKDYTLQINLPGYTKDNITAELKDGYLTISARKEEEKKEEDEKRTYIRKERFVGSCSRSFYVGDVSEEDIKAEFTNGVLTMVVPKESRQIPETKKILIEG